MKTSGGLGPLSSRRTHESLTYAPSPIPSNACPTHYSGLFSLVELRSPIESRPHSKPRLLLCGRIQAHYLSALLSSSVAFRLHCRLRGKDKFGGARSNFQQCHFRCSGCWSIGYSERFFPELEFNACRNHPNSADQPAVLRDCPQQFSCHRLLLQSRGTSITCSWEL